MKYFNFFCVMTSFLVSFSSKAQIDYPKTKISPVTTNYFGTEVVDNYQWLEKQESTEVTNWTEAQNVITKKYLKEILKSTKTNYLMNRFMFKSKSEYEGKLDTKYYKDKYFFKFMVSEVNTPPHIYFAKGITGSFEKLISPTSISRKDLI